jgi:hypothetical protein
LISFMRLFWMLTGISFTVSSGDHERLERIIGDPKSPQKHIWRARIIENASGILHQVSGEIILSQMG